MQLNKLLAALFLFNIGFVLASNNEDIVLDKSELSRRITKRFLENVQKIEKRAPGTKFCPYYGCITEEE